MTVLNKNIKVKAWALVSKKGMFIAAFRFKPKRVYQGVKGYGGYYAWTDCNGPVPHPNLESYASNTIEGSMNAVCKEITIQL